MADIRIFRGNQVGGCITVISTGKTKIVLDFGENLPGARVMTNIDFDWKNEKVDAVFFTHYHGDHIGRLLEIPDDVDLYMGEVTYRVMLNIRRAIKDWKAINRLRDRRKKGTLFFVERAVPIRISDEITVTGYSVDHSAYDAFMYLVEADGTNILHTGDYRDHGHRGHVRKNGYDQNVMLDVIRKYVLKYGRRNVDILITEGTMMGGRSGEERFSEKDLQKWATDYFEEHRHVFLKISSTNVDSLASFYHAAKAKSIPMYVNRYVLNQFSIYRAAGRKYGTDMYDFEKACQLPFLLENADNSKALKTLTKMRENGFVAVVNEYPHYERIMDELSDVNPTMIYSMWDGYLDPKNDAYNPELKQFYDRHHAISKHTSGHAYPEFIEQVIEAVNPTTSILPIHTENAKGFLQLNISDELRRKVIIYDES